MDEPNFGQMSSWHNYPSIYAIGHKAAQPLLGMDLIVEEKLDGSQFSFGIFDGELRMRSKGATINPGYPPALFKLAHDTVFENQGNLHPGWTYRAEAICSRKHNALTYDRIPNGGLIVFDIETEQNSFLDPAAKMAESALLGLECVPLFYIGKVTIELMREWLDRESCLGGPKIEGVVLKPLKYDYFGTDKKVVLGKYVSEAFKEVHRQAWGGTGMHIADLIASELRTEARWRKTVQHLRDNGQLEGSPRDIGPLMKELGTDLYSECHEEVAQRLFKHFWKDIQRAATRGFPEWYKNQLLEEAFKGES